MSRLMFSYSAGQKKSDTQKWSYLGQNFFFKNLFLKNCLKIIICELMLFELGDLLGSSLLRNFFSVARVIFSRKITVLAQKTTQKNWLFLGQNLFFTKPFLFNYLKTVICELMLLELGDLLGLSLLRNILKSVAFFLASTVIRYD